MSKFTIKSAIATLLLAGGIQAASASLPISGITPEVFAKGNRFVPVTTGVEIAPQALSVPEKNLELLLEEDFSLFTAGTDEEIDGNDLTEGGMVTIDNSYTHTPDWWGVGVYQAGGIAALQYPSRGGVICSPSMNLSGKVYISFRARAVAGNPLLMVNLLCGDLEAPKAVVPTQNLTIKAEDGWTDFVVVTENFYKGDDCFLQLNGMTYNKGLRIDDIKVYRDLDYIERPQLTLAEDFTAQGFTAVWSKVESADSYTLNLYEEAPTGESPLLVMEDFNEMDSANPQFPEGWEVTTTAEPLCDNGVANSRALHFTSNNDCVIIPGKVAPFNDFSLILKPGAELNEYSMACVMVSGRVSAEASWQPIVYGYAAQADKEGTALVLQDQICGRYSDLMLSCHYFGEGDEVIIDEIQYTTIEPTEIKPYKEVNGITTNYVELDGMNPEYDYYFTVSAIKNGKASEPTAMILAFGIAAPEVLEATEVSESSFTANWESVVKATSYNIDLFKCETVESNTPAHVILFEDFSKVTSDRTPDNPKLITDIDMANLDYYTQRKGWEGNGNVIADGMMGCTGNRNYELKLLSPYITLGNGGGDYTVKMKVYSYAGETLVVQATNCYATYDFETDGMHEFEFNMFSGTMKDRLQIYSLNAKTFLVDEITVSQNVKAGDVLLEYVRTEPEAEGNSFTFEKLSNSDDYAYIVRSNYKRFADKCESGLSKVMKVNFKNSVSDIAAAQALTVSVSGRTISVESPVAAQLYSADGRLIMSAPASFNHTVAAPGVYIVKAGNNYRKVAVK